MKRIAAKVAVEILVRFEQHDANAAARQQEREHDAARPSPNHTTVHLLSVAHLVLGMLFLNWRWRLHAAGSLVCHGRHPLIIGPMSVEKFFWKGTERA